jgi:hypothetical protein
MSLKMFRARKHCVRNRRHGAEQSEMHLTAGAATRIKCARRRPAIPLASAKHFRNMING